MITLGKQQGQVMAEAVIVLMLLSVFLVCVLMTSRWQLEAHEDLLRVHQHALRVSSGDLDQSLLSKAMQWGAAFLSHKQKSGAQSGQETVHKGRPLRRFSQMVPARAENLHRGFDVQSEAMRLQGDGVGTVQLGSLLGGATQWVKVKTRGRFSHHAWQLHGQASVSHTHETVARIERSEALWQPPSRRSQHIVRRLAPMTSRVDQPWGRRAPATDWLTSWETVSELDPSPDDGALKDLVDDVLFVGQKIVGGLF